MRFKIGDKVKIIGSEINTRVNDNIGERGVIVVEKLMMKKASYLVRFGREIEGLTYSCGKTDKVFYSFYENEIGKANNWIKL